MAEDLNLAGEAAWLLTWLEQEGFATTKARSFDRARVFLEAVAAVHQPPLGLDLFAKVETPAEAADVMRSIVLRVMSPELHNPAELLKWAGLAEQGKMVAVSMYCTLVFGVITKSRPMFNTDNTHFQLTPDSARMLRYLVETSDPFVMEKMGEWCMAMLQKVRGDG